MLTHSDPSHSLLLEVNDVTSVNRPKRKKKAKRETGSLKLGIGSCALKHDRGVRGFVSLSNSTDAAQTVTVRSLSLREDFDRREIDLAPHATRLLQLDHGDLQFKEQHQHHCRSPGFSPCHARMIAGKDHYSFSTSAQIH